VLKLNIGINRKSNITAFNLAVYDSCDELVFYPRQDFTRFQSYGSYGIDPKASEGRTVKTVTIDSMQFPAPVSLIKIDIQGADLFALRGAVQTIRRHRPAIIFEYEEQFQAAFNTSVRDYEDFVRAIGYRVERIVGGINYLILPAA
jgi:FkbM family methyltransferase